MKKIAANSNGGMTHEFYETESKRYVLVTLDGECEIFRSAEKSLSEVITESLEIWVSEYSTDSDVESIVKGEVKAL